MFYMHALLTILLISIAQFCPCSARDNSFQTNKNPLYKDYKIGDWTYGSPAILNSGKDSNLTIGRYCSIAQGVTIILDGQPAAEWVSTYPFYKVWPECQNHPDPSALKGKIVIGNDVWIGSEATILPGVHIGDGAVVGAKSLVDKDVPPYTIVGGVPARTIRLRIPAHLVDKMIGIAWWNWSEDLIASALPLLLSDNIELFVHHFGQDK